MAAIRSRSVTSAVRTCPSTIIRRAVAVSNMNSVPMIRRALCAAGSGKTQGPAKRTLRLRQSRRGGVKAQATILPVALPAGGRSFIERALRAPVATTPAPLKATWRSGYATVCKTVYPGSIPGVASNLRPRGEAKVARRSPTGEGGRASAGKLRPGKTKASGPGFPPLCCFQSPPGFVIRGARTAAAVPR